MSVLSIVGGSQTYSSASGGKVYAFNNLGTAFQPVAPANPARAKIIFHNPGTVNILIAPAVISAFPSGAQTTFVPTSILSGGCFLLYGNGGTLEISGECATGWQACAISASNNPLTVMDSNVP